MTATRTRRKATKKAPVRRKKPVATKLRPKSSGRRAAVKARVGKARTVVVRKVRALGAGLAAAGAAAVQALRGPAAPARELNGAANEEQRIESSKYLPRHAPKRLFETERFVFPESYGVNRLRLLVKDPEWLFAHWDVDPAILAALRADLGERALALSRLTLRLSDTVEGGSTIILLPKTARSFYIRADGASRSYQAELGLTLPSGEFRALAASNTVGTPRVGPSPEAARVRVRFRRSGNHVTEAAGALEASRLPAGKKADTRVVPKDVAGPGPGPGPGRKVTPIGGASDTYRR
jgi:uncharacterized protein